ncbi:MAG: hypothetical protein LBC86_08320 [Oscillospiraceae bacterium]|jgi:formylmethanofuran dehydrogenase subunit E-like metal-binding protein|nr:hypothetical protein [Oscillospiraceae bacterium]
MPDWLSNLIFVFVGAFLTFIATLILDYKTQKRERERFLWEKRINSYTKALQYIILQTRINEIEKTIRDSAIVISSLNETRHNLINEEEKLYKEFYYEFSLVAPLKVYEEFNKLREEIESGNIKLREVYKKTYDILQLSVPKRLKEK